MTTVIALLLWSSVASATTYYVSSSTGNDANSGTSSSAAWQTIAHVNGQSFNPGDSILFKRGDVWNESLAPASSGTSGNPITFDAYGAGAAPNLTGYYAVPATAWVLVTGNAWKAPVSATYTAINFCLFGSVWGQKVTAASSNLTAQWDFYLANGYVYVYSVGNPAAYYSEPIVPMALSNVPVININGQSWLTFQHFLVNWFDQYGVYVQGTSDHLVFANMEADSMIPQGTQPLGFYVDESAPGPGDIKIYNAEAHLNYDGFRFDGAATAITMVNDKGYANRDGALVDNTGAVTYSYCHFYASSLAVAGSTDVEWTSGNGPIAGEGNIAADTAPAVQVYQRFPAQVTLTVDDEGMTPGADTYYAGTVLPIADAAGVPVGAAITVGYPLAQTLVSEFQGWVNAGRDVTSHSMSHTYYTNTDALDIQYTGSGTAATLSISNKTLTITVTGAGDSVSYNLAQGQAQGTISGLQQALAATGKFTTSYLTPCQGPYGTGCSAYTAQALLAQDLADVSGQDVRTSVYHFQLNVTRLTTDEITLSRQWMTTNLTGLPTTSVYVYPGGYETTTMQGITAGVSYTGARGALKEDLGVNDTYGDGFNVQNITSFGVNPSWMGLEPSVLNQKIQALVWKESVWGVPWGIFWHLNELTNDDPVGGTEITNLIQDFKTSGATIQTNTGLVNWLLSGTQETGTDGNYYYKFPATSMDLDFRPTKNSPVVDAGQNLGTAYELDISGVNQNTFGSGWEIGAHVYQGFGVYGGGAGSGSFIIGPAPNENYTLTSQQPANVAAYSSNSDSVTTKPLPSDIMNHCQGNTSNCAAGDAIAKCAMTDCGNLSEISNPTYMGQFLTASPGNSDEAGTFYWSASTDPWYSISAATPSGLQTVAFHAPNGALFPEGNEFAMTVWDQATGWVVGIYACCGPQTGRGLPAATGCGSTQAAACAISNTYQSAAANFYTSQDYGDIPTGTSESSVQFAPQATEIREEELMNGLIPHAIGIAVDCVNSSTQYVFPSIAAALGVCGTGIFGPQNANRASGGTLIFSDYTAAQIASFGLPAWESTILTALSTYGAYVHTTGGPNVGIAWQEVVESAEMWKYYYPSTFLTADPFWAWINAQKGVNGVQPINGIAGCAGGAGGTNPSTYRCVGAILTNIPRTLGPEGSDAEGNSCTTGSGCYPSGHLHVADPCVAKGYAGVSGGCS
jgi:hypothetical protein